MLELPDELSGAKKVGVKRGRTVFQQGQVCQQYYIVLDGSIKVFARAANGKEVVLYRVAPGDICVLTTSCMLSNSRYPAEAAAESDVTAITLLKGEFDHLMHSSEQFRTFVFSSFGNRLSELVTLVEEVALESVELRLARYLYNRTDEDNLLLAATHQEIATEIGTVREVVSRQLKNLAARQVVAVNRGTITVLDRPALHRLGR